MSTHPDGISPEAGRPRFWEWHASPLSVLILGLIMLAALAGYAGGQPSPEILTDHPAATLRIKTPEILRNGEFFETNIQIVAKQPIQNSVVAISGNLWRDMTINSMLPAAESETSDQNFYRFSYGPLNPGDVLTIKFDGQINPPLFAGNRGQIALFDGDRLIGEQSLTIKVRP